MIKCPKCREENSTNVDYCHHCNAAISEYAQKREQQKQCPDCKTMITKQLE
jgi:phage FluMu protein Com